MKPNTTQAMYQLIEQIKTALPFDLPAEEFCNQRSDCKGCSLKLLEYLSMELDNWEYRLENEETPNFRDLSKLAKSAGNIYKVLKKNGLIELHKAKFDS